MNVYTVWSISSKFKKKLNFWQVSKGLFQYMKLVVDLFDKVNDQLPKTVLQSSGTFGNTLFIMSSNIFGKREGGIESKHLEVGTFKKVGMWEREQILTSRVDMYSSISFEEILSYIYLFGETSHKQFNEQKTKAFEEISVCKTISQKCR